MKNIEELERAIREHDAKRIAVRIHLIRGELESYAELQEAHAKLQEAHLKLKRAQAKKVCVDDRV